MQNLIIVQNVKGYINEDGTAFLNLEDVSRGLGFTRIATSGNEVIRWERVRKYLQELNVPTSGHDVNTCVDGQGRENLPEFVPENIFYKLCMKANNETARKFQDLVCDDILPTIRKTGRYIATPSIPTEILKEKIEIMKKEAIALEINAKVKKSEQFTKLAELTNDLRYREVLISLSANAMTDEEVLPLPRLEQRSYTAKELGKILGISSNMVGRIANKHNLKNESYSYFAQDKARGCNKSVESFKYYERVIPEFKKALEEREK